MSSERGPQSDITFEVECEGFAGQLTWNNVHGEAYPPCQEAAIIKEDTGQADERGDRISSGLFDSVPCTYDANVRPDGKQFRTDDESGNGLEHELYELRS